MVDRWRITAEQILSDAEIDLVLADLSRRSRRSRMAQVQRVVFRLATFAGLRASEIAGLRLSNLRLTGERPSIYVPKTIAKGARSRLVPLWSDATVNDLVAWREGRLRDVGGDVSALVVARASGQGFCRQEVRKRFLSACKALGAERLLSVTVHSGRHTFVSRALSRGVPIQGVRDAAGHASIATTNIYAHMRQLVYDNSWSVD